MMSTLEYDHIIVGAGSAGCVIAGRLATRTSARVLLVEAGDPGGRRPVNDLLHVRGNRIDFNSWAAAGNEGWSYADVLPLFRRMESFAGGESAYRGDHGPLSVLYREPLSELAERFFAAGSEAGLADQGRDFDYNARQQEETSFRYQVIQASQNPRVGAEYLRLALGHPNLTVRSRARAIRILIENGRAVGVELLQDGIRVPVRATQEVVVCGGAYGSAQLLMLSGIGPAGPLGEHGIDVVADLSGVGRNLQDQLILGVTYSSSDQNGLTPMVAEVGCFRRTSRRSGAQAPDLQIQSGSGTFLAPLYDRPGPGYTFAPVLAQPSSIGSITLASADPLIPARIQPNHLDADQDLDVLVEGIELSRELAHTSAYSAHLVEELTPGRDVRSRAELENYVRANARTLRRTVGTCAMGVGEDAVVDPHLRVRGVAGLRVADASIMPTVVAGDPHAAAVMIGERAADLIEFAHRSFTIRAHRTAPARLTLT